MYSFEVDGIDVCIGKLSFADSKEWNTIENSNKYEKKTGYNLSRIYMLARLYTKANQAVESYIVKTKTGKPLGYFVVAYNYSCTVSKEPIKIFLWFVEKGRSAIELEKSLDVKIPFFQITLNIIALELKNAENKLWLHADPKGGKDLLAYYVDKHKFKSCKYKKKLASLRFKDDGRYLYRTIKGDEYEGA